MQVKTRLSKKKKSRDLLSSAICMPQLIRWALTIISLSFAWRNIFFNSTIGKELEWEVVSRYGIPVEHGVGVFNGDMGRILEINETASCLVVEVSLLPRIVTQLLALVIAV